jgi:hypothetical protein
MRLAHAGRAEQDDVLGALDEAQTGELANLLAIGSVGALRAKRSATTSWTVPWTRGSASSRSHCSAS